MTGHNRRRPTKRDGRHKEMRYISKPETVEAYKFTEVADRSCPEWLQKMIDSDRATIDRTLIDGVARIKSCSVYMAEGRLKARIGDYIIRWPGGGITVESPRRFKEHFEREGNGDGN